MSSRYPNESESESHSVLSDSLRPGQSTGEGSLCLLQGIFPTQGLNPGLLHCRRSLPAEPQGKPKNIRVGGLSLLQRIFPTQESNQGLPHCRQILYQLSFQGIYPNKFVKLTVVFHVSTSGKTEMI